MYKLVVSDLGGEKRFCSAVARRLQSLGALTRGDRRAATGQDLQEFNVQTKLGIEALKKVFQSIDLGQSMLPGTNEDSTNLEDMRQALEMIGLGVGRKENEAGNVSRFLGRLLGLPVRLQNMVQRRARALRYSDSYKHCDDCIARTHIHTHTHTHTYTHTHTCTQVFNYFMDTLSYDIAAAEKEGNYSDAIRDLYGDPNITVTLQKAESFKSCFLCYFCSNAGSPGVPGVCMWAICEGTEC